VYNRVGTSNGAEKLCARSLDVKRGPGLAEDSHPQVRRR
jgi:hypothetical protein